MVDQYGTRFHPDGSGVLLFSPSWRHSLPKVTYHTYGGHKSTTSPRPDGLALTSTYFPVESSCLSRPFVIQLVRDLEGPVLGDDSDRVVLLEVPRYQEWKTTAFKKEPSGQNRKLPVVVEFVKDQRKF